MDGGKSSISWRFPIAFQIIPLFFLLGTVWFFPESPRWLTKVGRDQEARYILGRLRGTDPEGASKATAEYNDIRNIVALEAKESSHNSYLHMLFGIGSGELHTGRRVQLVIWLQIIQVWLHSFMVHQPLCDPSLLTGFMKGMGRNCWCHGICTDYFWNCRLRLHKERMDQRFEQHLLHVRHAYLRLHTRPNRATLDAILGRGWPGRCHVPCRRLLSSGPGRK